LTCWGDDAYGQLTPPAGTYSQISTGDDHTCGLLTSGGVTCWGKDDFGQSVDPTGTFTQVSAGGFHSCALQTDGTVTCWGLNNYGQSTDPSGTFSQVSAGKIHSCGVLTDGTITCWGHDDEGESTVPFPDLMVTKAHPLDTTPAVGTPFTWTIIITNTGNAPAVFGNGHTIFTDNLPTSGLDYGPLAVTSLNGVVPADYIKCGIVGGQDLGCAPSGGTVTVHAGGSFHLVFTATPSAAGTFTNPRAAGICQVDPGSVVTEDDETNNDCSDTVTIVDLDIARSDTDLRLAWNYVGADHYNVWWHTHDPFAIPAGDCIVYSNCYETVADVYYDFGAAIDGDNHFYIVEAVSASGSVFATSNRVGKLMFGIEPGTTSARRGGALSEP
jgi:uncharacterized repeat protein (TIGR01451 family)